MNVVQNVSAIFNSPEIAEMVLQSVQAGELAELEAAATLRLESERREHQVTGPEEADPTSGVDPSIARTPDLPARVGRRRARAAVAAPPAEPQAEPGDGHRIDLLA